MPQQGAGAQVTLEARVQGERLGAGAISAAWFGAASAALAGAALIAIALLVLKVPGVEARFPAAARLFPTGLALHVNLATHVWLFCFAAAVTTLVFPARRSMIGWTVFGLATAGAFAMVAAAALGARVVMSNYVPVIDHPLFLAGGAVIAIAVLFTCAGALWTPAGAGDASGACLLRAAAWSMIAAFTVLAAAFGSLPDGLSRNAKFEVLFWGFGHVLQIAFVLWMLAGWCELARDESGTLPFPRWLIAGTPWLAYAMLAAALGIVASEPVASVRYRESFTRLMAWGSWLAPLAFAIAAAASLRVKAGRAPRDAMQYLFWSALLFAAGCLAGIFIRGETTLVPAHYHGTIGAVTLTLMAWSMKLRALAARPAGDATAHLSLKAYGAGLAFLIAGLAWLGRDGTPRKALASVMSAEPGAAVALALAVGGGVLASVAAMAFSARNLLAPAAALSGGRPVPAVSSPRGDARPRAIALAIIAVVLGGAALSWLNEDPPAGRRRAAEALGIDARIDPEGHASSMRRIEFDARFRQAVVMLHARQYEHAAAALHRLLAIAPDVPEAHVNMGFAMIGLKRFELARDFFTGATELRPAQANAYYGLAVALEGLADLQAALGAMRTFVHLTGPDDPYLPKARAAIWEWQEQLAGRRAKSGKQDR